MQVLSYLVLAVWLCIGVYSKENNVTEDVARANAYIDEFIEEATKNGGFIDPFPLEEIGKSFERDIGFMHVKGEAKLYDGKMRGLSSIKRKGNAVVLDLDDFLIVSTQLSFKKLNASYNGAVLVNDRGLKSIMEVKVGSSNVSLILMVYPEVGNVTVMSFSINKLKDIRVSVHGLGVWGWAASILSSMALNAFEKPVAKAASVKLMDHFVKQVENIPYPKNTAE